MVQGDTLIYGICESVDGEKDPHCLMLTFRIIEVLSQLFPDPSDALAGFAHELFEILGCYFPIHFTHVSFLHDNLLCYINELSYTIQMSVENCNIYLIKFKLSIQFFFRTNEYQVEFLSGPLNQMSVIIVFLSTY